MSDGLVFDIQHYSVGDGPGIRTVVFLKGCPLRCPWCCNPESQQPRPELKHALARCRACGACVDACPAGAVSMEDGRPVFDRRRCCPSGAWPCVDACPHGAPSRVGETLTADAVMARVAADKAFYDNSGGGVTFSGGEPFAQAAFLGELLGRCRAAGIHTAVETCGYADAEDLRASAPLVDLFLFDLKSADRERHQAITGADNAPALENLEWLAARFADRVVVRIPLVPGFTDDASNLSGIAEVLARLRLPRAEVMPYHELGRDKYDGLGRPYLVGAQAPDGWREPVGRAVALLESRGLICGIGGE
jgi:pyruvate formate lyase activating enzyme